MNSSTESSSSGEAQRYIVWLLWFLVLGAIPVVARYDAPAWDLNVYRHALQSLSAGRDPYTDSIAVQKVVHRYAPTGLGSLSYVYSPITLPVLKFFGWLPQLLAATIYWLLYAAAVAVEIRFGLSLMTESERSVLQYYAPMAIFFPGFLGSDIVLSGNVAFILYGGVLLTAGRAIRTGRWKWFYAAVVIASCFKAPLLSLLAIPVLCARRQWLPAVGAGSVGLALFAVQPLLWPGLFRNYLKSVGQLFSFSRDFGFSPAGLYCGWRFDHHLPYSSAGMIFYLAYAIPLCATLLYLSRCYQRGDFSMREWVPVLLTGVILLNPRLIEYDVAPLALPMALICWRFFSAGRSKRATLLCALALFLPLNLLATRTWTLWKLTEVPLLVAFFLAGSVSMLRSTQAEPAAVGAAAMLTEA